MKRRAVFIVLALFFVAFLIFNIFRLDFDDLSFTINKIAYVSIISNILIIAAMLILAKFTNKKNSDNHPDE